MVKKRQTMKSDKIPKVSFSHPKGRGSLVQVLDIANLRLRQTPISIYQPARRDFGEILVTTSGPGSHWVDFTTVPLDRGDFLYLRPNQLHAFDRSSNHQGFLVIFLPEALANNPLQPVQLSQTPSAIRPSPDEAEILTNLVRLMFAAQRGERGLAESSALGNLLAALLAGLQSVSDLPFNHALTRAAELIGEFDALLDAHVAAKRNLAWYAAQLGVSLRTLGRACSQANGTTAKQYVDERVALEAKRLLVHGPRTVEEVASELGFSESTNFVKFFKRMVGSTPTSFRTAVTTNGRDRKN